jgi:hypothetical protein
MTLLLTKISSYIKKSLLVDQSNRQMDLYFAMTAFSVIASGAKQSPDAFIPNLDIYSGDNNNEN